MGGELIHRIFYSAANRIIERGGEFWMVRGDLWSGSLSPKEDDDQLPRSIWEDTEMATNTCNG